MLFHIEDENLISDNSLHYFIESEDCPLDEYGNEVGTVVDSGKDVADIFSLVWDDNCDDYNPDTFAVFLKKLFLQEHIHN